MVHVPLVAQEVSNTRSHLQQKTQQREGIFYALNDWVGALTKKQFPIEFLCERIRQLNDQGRMIIIQLEQ